MPQSTRFLAVVPVAALTSAVAMAQTNSSAPSQTMSGPNSATAGTLSAADKKLINGAV